MPHGNLHWHAINWISTVLRGEEISDEDHVGGVTVIQLLWLHVLHLWMVQELLHFDVVAANEHNTLYFKRRLLAEHAELTERPLLEALKPLDEAFEQVLEFVAYLSLLAEFVIMKEPEGPALTIDLLEELLMALASLIWAIY